ncbi:MAG TPA: ABC transporter transmembrane domain-containing protein, partial [Anaerolineales bacterium]
MNLEKNLIRQAQQAGWILALTVLTGLAGGGLVLLQAQRLSEVIARVFLRGQVLVQVMPLLAGLLLIFLLRSLMLFLGETMAGLAAVRVKNNLREMLFQKLFALGPAYTQGEHSGELSSTLTQGVEQLDAYFSQYLPQLVLAAGVPLVILLAAFSMRGDLNEKSGDERVCPANTWSNAEM